MVKERLQMGGKVDWCPDGDLGAITARTVAEAARNGDTLAKEVYSVSARYLGKGLSIIIDILNPELVVIGSIYARNEDLFKPLAEEIIAKEALPLASKVCRIVPAALGESIGDYAALSVAADI
jgi:glucokinase